MSSRHPRRNAQRGMVLILIAFIIGLGAAAFMYKMLNASNSQAAQDEQTMRILGEAKAALIAWSVSHPNFPGIMPFPDRNDDPNKYDSRSDCVAAGLDGSHLIGRLPVLSDVNCVPPQNGLGFSQLDSGGEPLWYSVSQNLIRKSAADSLPVVNPGIVNAPVLPWFVVRNRNGAIISDRVAVVIFSPGAPLPNQDRSGGGADANQYLDKIVMADGTSYKNYGYQDAMTNPVQDFIIGDDYRAVSKTDPTYKDQSAEPYYYNDKLVYITIDELMVALEARAANALKNALLNYYEPVSAERPNARGVGYFPFAASLGSSKDYACVTSNVAGVLPIGSAASTNFTCDYSRGGGVTSASCSTGFTNINSIVIRRNNNFTGSSGACTYSGRDCTCTGTGSCSRNAQAFSCNAAGSCSANFNGTVIFKGGEFTSASSRCSLACTDATCSGGGSGSATRVTCADQVFNTGGSQLPAWIMANQWYDYFYYASSRNGVKLTGGGKTNVDSLLVGTGRTIVAPNSAVSKGSTQLRPSCTVSDYLDSIENADADEVFDRQNITRTPNYNDHTYIVAP